MGRRGAVEVPRGRLGRAVRRGRGGSDRDAGARERRVRAGRARAAARGPERERRRRRADRAPTTGATIGSSAIVDARGGGATFTGSACVDWAGGLAGDCFAAQGNILVSESTVYALAETFLASAGSPLAERLLACLGGGAGGGRRSARAAVGGALRRARGRRLRRPERSPDRPARRRAPDPDRRARAHLRHAPHALRRDAARPDWIDVDDALRVEIATRLAALGYAPATTAEAFARWADTENLEERVDGFDRVDPVVLDELRRARLTALPTFATRCSYTPPRQSCTGPRPRAVRNDEGKDSFMRRKRWVGTIAVATTCAFIGAAGGIATSGAASSAGTAKAKTAKTTTAKRRTAGLRRPPWRWTVRALRVGAAEQGRDGLHHGDP